MMIMTKIVIIRRGRMILTIMIIMMIIIIIITITKRMILTIVMIIIIIIMIITITLRIIIRSSWRRRRRMILLIIMIIIITKISHNGKTESIKLRCQIAFKSVSLCWAKTVYQQFCQQQIHRLFESRNRKWTNIRAYFTPHGGYFLFIWSHGSFTFLFCKLYMVLNYLIFSERNSVSHEANGQLSFTHAMYDECHYLKKTTTTKNKPMRATTNRLKLPRVVGFDVDESPVFVLSAFLALVGMTRVPSTLVLRGGDDVPYNIKDQLWSLP